MSRTKFSFVCSACQHQWTEKISFGRIILSIISMGLIKPEVEVFIKNEKCIACGSPDVKLLKVESNSWKKNLSNNTLIK